MDSRNKQFTSQAVGREPFNLDDASRAELLWKYREIADLRQLDQAGHPVDRLRLRQLAARCPGALTELDRLAPAVVEWRIERLLRTNAQTDRFALAWAAVHDHLRGALWWKRSLIGTKSLTEALEVADTLANDAIPASAVRYRLRLAELLSPPLGRLKNLVFADVSAELGISVSELRTWLDGAEAT